MNREKLIAAGVDYDEGVSRFGGMPALYEKYLLKFLESDFLDSIRHQLDTKDISGAFRTTHDLKGVAGNLSMNRLYAAVCVLTEQLREGNADADYSPAFCQMAEWFEKAAAARRE